MSGIDKTDVSVVVMDRGYSGANLDRGKFTVRPTQGDFYHANEDSCDSPYIKVISYLPVLSW
jgi:hypothetical protein